MRLAGGLAGSDVDKRLREDLRGGGAVASGRADAVLYAEQAGLPALTEPSQPSHKKQASDACRRLRRALERILGPILQYLSQSPDVLKARLYASP